MKKEFVSGIASGAGKAVGAALVLWLLSLLPPVREKLIPHLLSFAREEGGLLLILLVLLCAVSLFVAFLFYRKYAALLKRARTNGLTIGDYASAKDLSDAIGKTEDHLRK